ncbi:MAG: 2-oxoacid:acceptor oxidoreductase subunit alpha [Candidatus Marinimicrobia bacterium]|jgi:2-oxoglutarate ferredoxin oxidoreductase subunit alpha|nr:2-oxoacid:acceptor oxidoreductase subunit alpha [Candidatus Neomarinimicrobiota bacterium]MBT3946200.1 2-oxoacid:acceptor oxidoreductase subunit alpha [Candidatus Neomarinimicrobiota bacterium]MBT4154799.1 2-oxoacid:acceptor oxidoreductase subunit alpha [Candidatus Neomarinimicrobiota bacterium]MBT4554316.1 2-oxoacid:acceptor oxidoreductase subunit alpha [Candidatus Neomarinimicrobiota bacterium]MBT4753868.1 2-oxoacid:acceptor oxidoreductase subunit alpha [Candidatus Neomarinimicrobiota bact|tara:strand:+ start:11102 stop:12943 length:1842 start_codon:yes stop_codon:yes gene_type:complete
MGKTFKTIDEAVIRFAGDSGDGMQLTGGRFTDTTAIVGNDLSTLPDFPAEIRAPAGSLAGVSAFQIKFSSKDIHTPGDKPDVLVAMNPAALKVHQKELIPGGTMIVNKDAFTTKNLKFAGYETNPIEDGSLDDYFTLIPIEMNKMVTAACEGLEMSPKLVGRTKNLFALGVLFYMYDRPLESTEAWLKKKFKGKDAIIDANTRALNAGYNYGDTTELFMTRFKVEKANLASGNYRNMNGNFATSLGLLAAAEKSGLNLFYGGYPITPASDILQTLASWKHFGVSTFQAEDEIASISSVIGAAFTGSLAVTATSGPGIALKAEAIGLGIITELPMVIINVQRGGPSTGLPTKTEQSDLNQALFGRNGESPMPIIAAATPGDCFFAAYEACRIALKYMTPVMLLSDGYLANGSEPWKIPNVDELEDIPVNFAKKKNGEDEYLPYLRDDETLSRPWAIPGTPGLEHRVGGIEKAENTGHVSYDPENHHKMTLIREEKVNRIRQDIPALNVFGESHGDLLILSWGGTYGSCRSASETLQEEGKSVSHIHLRWVNPLPQDLGELIVGYKNVLIPEINMGQLLRLIRAEYLVDAKGLNQVRGRPISTSSIIEKVNEMLG